MIRRWLLAIRQRRTELRAGRRHVHTIVYSTSRSGSLRWARCAPCRWGAAHPVDDDDGLARAVAAHAARWPR